MVSISPLTPLITCACFVLLVFTIATLDTKTLSRQCPPWLLGPLLRLRSIGHVTESDHPDRETPESALAQQLAHVDVNTEPDRAHKLHMAIGNMLRASDALSKQRAISHFEAARDAAKRTNDPDMILSSHLELAEAYIEQGRPLDSQHELAVASGVVANHFAEHNVKLNRGRGRAKFELGFTDSALYYFEEARKQAVHTEDVVNVACDISMVRTCLGQAAESVEPLSHALEVLRGAKKVGMDEAVYTSLAAEVYFRLAQAYHSDQSFQLAQAHYEKALHLQQKMSRFRSKRALAIRDGLKNVRRSIAPELHCPSRPQAPWEVPKNLPSVKDPKFFTEINYLMADEKYDMAESKLELALKAFRRPYKTLEATVTLNMLGDLYLKRSDVAKAARKFRQSIQAALVCCGADSPEAQTAYEGLEDARNRLPEGPDRKSSELWMKYYSERSSKLDASTHVPSSIETQEQPEVKVTDAEREAAFLKRMESDSPDKKRAGIENQLLEWSLQLGKSSSWNVQADTQAENEDESTKDLTNEESTEQPSNLAKEISKDSKWFQKQTNAPTESKDVTSRAHRQMEQHIVDVF